MGSDPDNHTATELLIAAFRLNGDEAGAPLGAAGPSIVLKVSRKAS